MKLEAGAKNCPKCKAPLVVKQGMFYYRGRTFTGLICEPCNALWDNPDDSFEEHAGLKAKVVT